MQHIADAVGVSTKSVSRVLNGEPGTSPETSRRILAAAQELGFRRNDLARGLARGDRTGTIGLVLRHSSTRFYDKLIRGVEEVAREHDTLVLTAGSHSPERERPTVLALSSRRVDGMLVVPVGDDHGYLRAELASGLPIVFVDRPPIGLAADAVLSNDRGGGRAATAHLLAHGHRRIGVIGASDRVHTVGQRIAGHHDAVESAGLARDPRLLHPGVDTVAEATRTANRLLLADDAPTALLTLNSICTLGTVRALRDLGLSGRVALVGYDDFDTADLLDPPVTVVSHDVVEVGRRAATRLFERVAGDDRPPSTEVLPSTLIVRGSGELPPAGRRTGRP
jgi:LacI family transcriptional regulator